MANVFVHRNAIHSTTKSSNFVHNFLKHAAISKKIGWGEGESVTLLYLPHVSKKLI